MHVGWNILLNIHLFLDDDDDHLQYWYDQRLAQLCMTITRLQLKCILIHIMSVIRNVNASRSLPSCNTESSIEASYRSNRILSELEKENGLRTPHIVFANHPTSM